MTTDDRSSAPASKGLVIVLPDGLTGSLLLGATARLAMTLNEHARDDVLAAAITGTSASDLSPEARLQERYEELVRESDAAIRRLERIVARLTPQPRS